MPAAPAMISTIQLFTLLVVPLVVACEGECITNITHKYLNLYSPIILDAFQNMACTPACLSSLCRYL